MDNIIRKDVNEDWAHSGVIEAGDFVYIGYCVGNVGKSVEEQINGAINHLSERLAMVDLSLDAVIQVDCLFRNIWNIPIMEEVFKKRFAGKYPVRKSIQTEFAHKGGKDGLHFQMDAVAYKKNKSTH